MLSRRIVPRGSPLSPFAPCARAQFLVAVHVFELCSEPPAPALPGAADDDDADDGASDALSAAEAISVARAVRVRFVCPFLRRIVLDTFPAATREQDALQMLLDYEASLPKNQRVRIVSSDVGRPTWSDARVEIPQLPGLPIMPRGI